MQGKIHKHPRANTAGFDANPQNINRKGRPRRLVSGVIKELEAKGVERVSQTDVKDTFLMLINLEIEEIEEITKSKKHPAIVRIVAREMLGGKGFDVIEKMLDRAIGRPDSKIDHTSTDGSMSPKGISITVSTSDHKKTVNALLKKFEKETDE